VDEEGRVHDVNSADVNEYLHDLTDCPFTAKDFRTWAGTLLAARALQEVQAFDSPAPAKRNVVRAIQGGARRPGQPRALRRKCYAPPAAVEAYLDGSLRQTLRGRVEAEIRGSLRELRPEEAAVLAFLQERLRREAARK